MGTGMAIFLIVLFVLCVILLLPVCVKFRLEDGQWELTVKYLWIRIFRKASEPPKTPQTPPLPDPEADTPEPPPAEPEPAEEKSKKKKKKRAASEQKPDEAAASESPPAEETSSDSDSAQPADHAADKTDAKPRKKRGKKDHTPAGKGEKPKKRSFIKRLKPHGLKEILATAKDVFAALSPSLKFLFRHFHFRHVKLYLAVGSDDPANTAQLYGKICAGAYPLLAALQSWLDIETDEFRILADFYNESVTVRTSLELRVSPAALILTVLILGVKFLWRAWCRFRREDREERRIREETEPLPAETAA